MSTLHLINKTDVSLWRICAAALISGDTLLLIEDAVYAALPSQSTAAEVPAGVQVSALAEDLAARGISAKIQSAVSRSTYNDFVALSLTQDRVVSWQ
jgi:tRNA 2-thiouridine synthesizing protein B